MPVGTHDKIYLGSRLLQLVLDVFNRINQTKNQNSKSKSDFSPVKIIFQSSLSPKTLQLWIFLILDFNAFAQSGLIPPLPQKFL